MGFWATDRLFSEKDLDPGLCADEFSELCFQLGLIEKSHVPPARVPFLRRDFHSKEFVALRVHEAGFVAGAGWLQEGVDLLPESESLKRTDALAVDPNRAWKFKLLFQSLVDRDTESGTREEKGGEPSNGAVAHD